MFVPEPFVPGLFVPGTFDPKLFVPGPYVPGFFVPMERSTLEHLVSVNGAEVRLYPDVWALWSSLGPGHLAPWVLLALKTSGSGDFILPRHVDQLDIC